MAETKVELTPLAKMLLGGFAVIVLGGTVIGGISIFGERDNNNLVILKADTEPFKKAPAEKGGLKINSLDSPVLSLLDKAEEIEEGVEVLRPPISEPEPPPIEVTEDVKPAETAEVQITENTEVEPKAEISIVEPAQVVEVTPSEADKSSDDKTTPEASAETVVKSEDNAETDEISSAISSIPAKRPDTPKIVATTDINSPSYVVQFAAFKNETRAKNTAAVLSTKHKSRLDGMAIGYMRWGDYWRVVAEPMPRADANSLCSMFRSVGQECIIKLMETPNG